jgi:RNA polymerase subunit RPABC4/transcription elongation factor Spt4
MDDFSLLHQERTITLGQFSREPNLRQFALIWRTEMHDEQKINPKHSEIRQVLRILGPLAAAVGLLLIATGFGSFFMSFGTFEPPRYFWCAFLGMPLLFLGIAMSQFGFLGAVARYQARELAPVGKDTFNYLAEGTKDGVQTIASAVAAGFAQDASQTGNGVPCPRCGHVCSVQAKFCDACGTSLAKACSSCGHVNDRDANFCANCGNGLT